jgi:hypothetical protein
LSYTPPPYQPPQGPLGLEYQRPTGAAFGPARGAAVMMWIIGALMLLCGSGLVAMTESGGWGAIWKYAEQTNPQLVAQMNAQGQTPEQIRIGYLVFGGIGIVVAVALLILGIFVFRRRVGAIVTSIVLTSLLLLGNVCMTGSMTIMAGKLGPAGIGGSCVSLIPLIVLGVLLYLLLNSAKGGTRMAQTQRHQYQDEFWRLPQQQQTSQGGYGYGAITKLPESSAPPQQSLGEVPPPPAKGAAPEEPPT